MILLKSYYIFISFVLCNTPWLHDTGINFQGTEYKTSGYRDKGQLLYNPTGLH